MTNSRTIRNLKLLTALLLVALAVSVYFNLTSTESKEICMDYDAERMSTLDADLIHTMTRGYRSNHLKYIETETGTIAPKDAYSIWFDLPTLKKYLYHIEKKSKMSDTELGVRFYYAAYPANEDEMGTFKDLKDTTGKVAFPEYSGLHTLVLIPTFTDGDGNNVDFNPLDDTTFKEGFSKNSKYAFGSTSPLPDDTAALSATPSRDMGARNHGTLSPPKSTTGFGF